MRSRRSSQEQLAEVARRRLELLSAELAEIRPDHASGPPEERLVARLPDRGRDGEPAEGGGSGEPRRSPADGGAIGRHAHRSLGPRGMVSGWVRDRLPPPVQAGVGLSVAHVAVVASVLVAGLLVTLWWLARAQDEGTVVPAVSSPTSAPPSAMVSLPSSAAGTEGSQASGRGALPAPAGTPAAAGPAPSVASGSSPPTASGSVVVDVAGKVRRPGIATLPPGSRVVDAVQAAGGVRRGVRMGSLNLARLLTDGEQIVVGMPAPAGVAASAASAPTSTSGGTGAAVPMVDINTAGQAELELLPGIGPVTAQSILAFRSERGTFTSVDELLEVSGIGDATLAKIAPHVTL